MNEKIRAVIAQHARLPRGVEGLSDDEDLYSAGMSSQASVNVMLALEDAFGVEFPDRLLTRAVFSSIASIRDAISELTSERAA